MSAQAYRQRDKLQIQHNKAANHEQDIEPYPLTVKRVLLSMTTRPRQSDKRGGRLGCPTRRFYAGNHRKPLDTLSGLPGSR
jgi:hypothetical protein